MDTEKNFEQESGVTFGELFSLFKKNIIFIIIITLFCTIIGAIYGLVFKETTYKAQTQAMVVSQTAPGDQSNEYQNYLLSNYMVNTFKGFLTSDAVLKAVSEKTGISPKALREKVSVTTDSGNLLVTISYESNNSEEAIKVANAIVEEAIRLSNEKKIVGDKEEYTVAGGFLANKLFLLNEATETTGSRGASVIIIITFLVGVILSYGIILVKYLMDDTYTSKTEFEETFGINVLTLVEDAKIGGDK